MNSKGSIVIVESDDLIRELLERWLGDAGYWVTLPAKAHNSATITPQLVIADISSPDSAEATIKALAAAYSANAVTAKDEEVQARFGIDREVFNHAEYGKDIVGGFKEERVAQQLLEAGFSSVVFHYDWFLGEGFLINSGEASREELLREAASVNAVLQRALPLSKALFKYLGFVATK